MSQNANLKGVNTRYDHHKPQQNIKQIAPTGPEKRPRLFHMFACHLKQRSNRKFTYISFGKWFFRANVPAYKNSLFFKFWTFKVAHFTRRPNFALERGWLANYRSNVCAFVRKIQSQNPHLEFKSPFTVHFLHPIADASQMYAHILLRN